MNTGHTERKPRDRITVAYVPTPALWCAIDSDTYDVDCDARGYFSHSPVGWGKTPDEARADLRRQIEDEA